MSHIHIPDGVLPWWLWLSGWIAATVLIGIAADRATRSGSRRAVPLIGAVSALVLVAMSSEIVPIAYHVNLTVIAGVLLGPWLGLIAAFIVVLVLALLGHGGVTVVGLNALVIGTEIALGWALVRTGVRLAGLKRIRPVAAVSTVLTLAVTTTMLVGIVALAGAPATGRETGALDAETLEFRNPLSGGLFSIGLLGGHDHEHAEDEHEGEHAEDEHEGETLAVSRFAAVVYTLGPIGWLLEALVTAAVLGYVGKVRPGLLFGGQGVQGRVGRIGDEHGGR
ncbi:MAG: energy-coupling factor ABC transporter permease [Coriobacteriia bacterium]|nr:energy-coupling factor ABC transporter permease [Coriobacteriia bacterium]MBN2840893.1 energy-coupling factor ABC transporter permease [Coriobacteriia bacterium]